MATETKNNLTADRNPSIHDDESAGYSVGSRWINGDAIWECVSATDGAARWGRAVMAQSLDFPDELNFLLALGGM